MKSQEDQLRQQLRRTVDAHWSQAPSPTFKIPPEPHLGVGRRNVLIATVIAAAVAAGATTVFREPSVEPSSVGPVADQRKAEPKSSDKRGDGPCAPFAPRELPNGEAIGKPSVVGNRVSWGVGKNRVVQAPGEDVLGVLQASSEFPMVDGERIDAVIAPVGDPGVADIAIVFLIDDCTYTVWIQASNLDDAARYARNY